MPQDAADDTKRGGDREGAKDGRDHKQDRDRERDRKHDRDRERVHDDKDRDRRRQREDDDGGGGRRPHNGRVRDEKRGEKRDEKRDERRDDKRDGKRDERRDDKRDDKRDGKRDRKSDGKRDDKRDDRRRDDRGRDSTDDKHRESDRPRDRRRRGDRRDDRRDDRHDRHPQHPYYRRRDGRSAHGATPRDYRCQVCGIAGMHWVADCPVVRAKPTAFAHVTRTGCAECGASDHQQPCRARMLACAACGSLHTGEACPFARPALSFQEYFDPVRKLPYYVECGPAAAAAAAAAAASSAPVAPAGAATTWHPPQHPGDAISWCCDTCGVLIAAKAHASACPTCNGARRGHFAAPL